MASTATVATRPLGPAHGDHRPARSIWASIQPPKISPLALASAGMAMVRIAGSRPGRRVGGHAVLLNILWISLGAILPHAACFPAKPITIIARHE